MTQSGLFHQEYAGDLLKSFMEAAGFDSTDYDAIVDHGCHCKRLSTFHSGDCEPIDERDHLCKAWFEARNCNDHLLGGSCNDGTKGSSEYFLGDGEYTMQVPDGDSVVAATVKFKYRSYSS